VSRPTVAVRTSTALTTPWDGVRLAVQPPLPISFRDLAAPTPTPRSDCGSDSARACEPLTIRAAFVPRPLKLNAGR
jgi:hypothetical protein